MISNYSFVGLTRFIGRNRLESVVNFVGIPTRPVDMLLGGLVGRRKDLGVKSRFTRDPVFQEIRWFYFPACPQGPNSPRPSPAHWSPIHRSGR